MHIFTNCLNNFSTGNWVNVNLILQEVNGSKLVYLDNAATSQKPTMVLKALQNYYETYNSNVHRGIHFLRYFKFQESALFWVRHTTSQKKRKRQHHREFCCILHHASKSPPFPFFGSGKRLSNYFLIRTIWFSSWNSAKATEQYELARKKIASFINAPDSREIVFTKNATEAINLVAYSWGLQNLRSGDEVAAFLASFFFNITESVIV